MYRLTTTPRRAAFWFALVCAVLAIGLTLASGAHVGAVTAEGFGWGTDSTGLPL